MDEQTLIEETVRQLRRRPTLPYEVAQIGRNLFLLTFVVRHHRDAEVAALLSQFNTVVHSAGLLDLVARQMNYALRIAEADGELVYEELHKLLSLCDSVHGLAALGLPVDRQLQSRFENGVRTRLNRQVRAARMAAQDRVAEWSRLMWWYSELLDDRSV